MDLHEYLRLFRRRWRLLATCVLLAGVAAWITTPAEPDQDTVTWRATHQLLRDSGATAPAALSTVSLLVKTREVPIRAAERLGYDGEPAVLAAGITLEADEQIGTLDITATGGSRAAAVRKANVFAEETLALLGEQAEAAQRDQLERVTTQISQLQVDIDALEDEIAAADAAGQSTDTLEATRDSKLRQYGAALDQQQQVLDQPPPSAGYISLQEALPELAKRESGGFSAPSSRPARTAFAAAFGLLLGLGVVLLVERLDTRVHDVGAVASAFGLPVVAEVPLVASRRADRTIITAIEPMSATAEAHRSLRSALLLSPVTVLGLTQGADQTRTEEPTVILVTSPAPGDGKTTTAANLAVALAEAGRRVLVLGCDFRRPEIHTYFGVDTSPGIADILTGGLGGRDLEGVVRATGLRGVSIAPSGAKLRSFGDVAATGRELVEQARSLADVVIIDTAPLLATNDASELIPACDAVVIVARIGKTTQEGARRTRVLLERLGAPVAGVVAVGAPDAGSTYASYYTTPSSPQGSRGATRRRDRADGDMDSPASSDRDHMPDAGDDPDGAGVDRADTDRGLSSTGRDDDDRSASLD